MIENEIISIIDEVKETEVGNRLDQFLVKRHPEYSRSHIQKLIKSEQIQVNYSCKKANYLIRFDDIIELHILKAKAVDIVPQNIPLDILYEDQDVLVVNKPKGMVVHPANGHMSDTLVNAIMYHCQDELSGINGEIRPGIVHRIDMDTTGSLIVCKNDKSHIYIANQIKEHSVKRVYVGIVKGVVKEDCGTINEPIGRDLKNRKKMAIHVQGKSAITHYKVLERFDGYTYMQFELETGRTHQIRVHMASIHHPLVGDILYGSGKTNLSMKLQGQTLHAQKIGFIHPSTKEYIEVQAPLPDYFEKLLAILRNKG